MDLSKLSKLKARQRKAKRVGQGIGSGKGGHTSGRGQKGQKSRTGYKIPVGFEGGQEPLYKKIPVRKGFVSSHKELKQLVDLDDLNKFNDGDKVTVEALIKSGLVVEGAGEVKVLAVGELKKKITLDGIACSKSAAEKIAKLNKKA